MPGSLPRSHALRGNARRDAPCLVALGAPAPTEVDVLARDAERLDVRSHAERGNEGPSSPARGGGQQRLAPPSLLGKGAGG